MPSKSIHVAENGRNFVLFYSWVVFPSTDIPHLLYPFLCYGHLGCFQSVCSVAQLCLTLRDPVDCNAPGFPVINSQSLLKLMSIELVMPSSYFILCRPLLLLPSIFPASGSFQVSQLFASGGHSIAVSASTSVLPMNTQDWSPLGWTGWISLQSKGLSRVFSNTTVQKHQFFGAQLSSQANCHIPTWPRKNHSFD